MNSEQALAEALHLTGHSKARMAHPDWSDEPCGWCRDDAAAILATPQIQAIARQAAIGAAVERLPRYFTIAHSYDAPRGERWRVMSFRDDDALRAGRFDVAAADDDPLAAVAAALEGQP